MNSNERTHPIEIALFLALVTVEAVVVLASALVALILTATNRQPSASRTKPSAPPATPMVHPLCNLAADLQELTCTELRALSGTRKRLNKSQLVGMVVAVGV